MTEERFGEILKEEGYTEEEIAVLWNTRPPEDLDEQRLRDTAKAIAPGKHLLRLE